MDGAELRPRLPPIAQTHDVGFGAPGFVAISPADLGPAGCGGAFAERANAHHGWPAATIALFDAGFARYWERGSALATRTATWPPPSRTHVVVSNAPTAFRPYAPLCGGAARVLHGDDLDPRRSDPELIAWLLVLADWMAATGEVAMAAMRAGAWWLGRTDEECVAFARAAAVSTRPDAAGVRAVADALPWLRALHHLDLRPDPRGVCGRTIPGTGLVVPPEYEAEPPALVTAWERTATDTLASYRQAWRRRSAGVRTAFVAWVRETIPSAIVVAGAGRTLWDPEQPAVVGALRHALAECDDVAVDGLRRDLDAVARVTRDFARAVVDRSALPDGGGDDLEHRGYVHLHPTRPLLVYDLDEPGMERRLGPPLPFEHEMTAARAAHELGHLADRAGWISGVAPLEVARELGSMLDDVIADAPREVAVATAPDLAELGGPGRAGAALVRILLTRAPDWRANLVLARLASPREREAYAWSNVRRLTRSYPPAAVWRLLVRYLYEYQYLRPPLGLVALADPWHCFDGVTNVTHDLVARGVVARAAFVTLAARVAALFTCFRIDDRRLRLP